MMNVRLQTTLVFLSAVSTLLAGCLTRLEPTGAPVAARQSTPQPVPISDATATSTPRPAPTSTPQPAATSTPRPAATSTPRPAATSTPQPTATEAPPAVSVPAESGPQEGFTEGGEPFKGDPAAPVLVEEFSSYQCPFCKRYFQETWPHIVANYVEAGLVRYVFRDFPLSSQPQSLLAAAAASCAGQAGGGSSYWAMHDLLFERQTEWSGRADARGIFEGYAAGLGLDMAAFGECVDSGATQDQILADAREGASRGVRGTPTFYINGQPLVGAQPYDVIAQAIDAALVRETSAEVTLNLAPASALPAEMRQLPPQVQEAYRFALANPNVLKVMPCYCGCNQVGHENNRMCYVQSETADGRVVLDNHAAT